MANFKVKSKKQNNISKKPRVYFTCHPDDFKEHFEEICEDIFATHDCAIYYTEDMSEVIDEKNKETDLERFNLFVVPVTFKLLQKPNRAMDDDVKYAMDKHIPLLPIMMEPGLDPIYSKPDKFGELQYLNYRSTDETEIHYKDKLRKYLDSVLISDELANRVRAAFDAYIFLSYRKKDRRYANELMRLIHNIPGCEDIAIWFDEFLTPGESFKENIEKILYDCKLFTLLVTPNLLEEPDGKPNFVMGEEYPKACKAGRRILPTEMEKTDRIALAEKFKDIPECIKPKDGEAVSAQFVESLQRIATETNNTPEHNFLIGLAYLDGIDVEIDRERAANLIIDAANSDLPEAMVKLIAMYIDGNGVKQSNDEAEKWSKRLAAHYFKTSFTEEGTIKSEEAIRDLFSNYKNEYWSYTTKHFLITCDEKLSLDTLKLVYELLMSTDVREYTLLLDTCKELKCHKKGTQEILVADILKKTANGTFPPYGPLFWYVPEYELYAPLLNALESFATDEQFTAEHFTNALALSRDVCWIFGHYNTVTEITESVNGKELFDKATINGIRRGLCELFYTGTTDELDGDDIYPRCFNIAEAKHWQAHGQGLFGHMKTAFEDELGLYSHEMFSELNEEYIGIVAAPYNRKRLESVLTQKSCKKLCGLFLSLPDGKTPMDRILGPLAINDKHLKMVYSPEHPIFLYPWPGIYRLDNLKGDMLYFYNTVHIPERITWIDSYAFEDCTSLTEITIPDSVKGIGWSAFSGCTSLTEITIPDSVTEIKEQTFRDCTALTKVTIPDNVTKIEEDAFSGCTSLTEITIPDSVTAISVSSLPERARAMLLHTFKSSLGAFENCTSLAEITIPNSVTEIGKKAFSGCTSLTRVTIPDSVTKIGWSAFSGCTSLTEITIPDSVTKIEEQTFSGCTSLTKITIPDSVTEIERWAFSGCTSLTEITIPDSVMRIGLNAFAGCSSLKRVNNCLEGYNHSDLGVSEECEICRRPSPNGGILEIPYGTKIIKSYEYSGRLELREVVIPDSVTEIGEDAFENCTSLTKITIPDSVTEIRNSAFRGCTSLTEINIPDSVTEVRGCTFKNCTALTKITIPNSVTEVGWSAFSGCTSLTEITIPDSVTKIEEETFRDCTSLTEITIPDSVTEIERWAFSGCTSLTKVTIPDSVTEIGWSAFSGCTSLTEINIPDSVTIIGEDAFWDCTSLTEVTIPNGVTEVRSCTFKNCTALTKITIPDSVTKISWDGYLLDYGIDVETADGSRAFSGCLNLEEITIPNSVTEIGPWTFEYCTALKRISIPVSVRTIGDGAFCGCTGLKEITVPSRFEEDLERIFEDVDLSKIKINWL